MQFLDIPDLHFRRDQTEFLYALYSGWLTRGASPTEIKLHLLGLANRPSCTLTIEQIEGLIERLGLAGA